jgi:hypothetical protein
MGDLPISQISNATFRRAAEALDQKPGLGNQDGAISVAEIDAALSAGVPDAERAALVWLRTFVAHGGGSARIQLSAGTLSAVGARAGNAAGTIEANKPPLVLDMRRIDGVTTQCDIPSSERDVPASRSVLVPLDEGQLHIVELRYHDNRKLKDLELNWRAKGSFDWTPFRGEQWFEMKKKEGAGEIEIKREPDHNEPWLNNPVRVKVEVLYPDGRVHDMGKKLVDPHIHDAHSVDGSGSPETDNIYKQMPPGRLPAGCFMRLTPYFENQKPWEQDRTTAIQFHWVRPVMIPPHKERARVFGSGPWQPIDPNGYAVDPKRTISAVLVTWTDEGGTSRGSVSLQGEHGRFSSPPSNIGSGETELIAVGAKATDGKLFVHGHGSHPVKVRSIEVLYAD